MTVELHDWSLSDHLKTPEDMIRYLEIAFEDGDPEDISFAIEDVARLRDVELSDSEKLGGLDNLLRVMKSLGLELARKAA